MVPSTPYRFPPLQNTSNLPSVKPCPAGRLPAAVLASVLTQLVSPLAAGTVVSTGSIPCDAWSVPLVPWMVMPSAEMMTS